MKILKVSEIIKLSPTAKALRFKLEGKPFPFRLGQFITIQKQPFSISSSPTQDYLELTVKGALNHLKVGDEVRVTDAFGSFYFDETNKHIMLIGAGSGISPLMSILRYVKEKNLDMNVHIISSNKTENEILWRTDIEFLSQNKNISHEFTLTRENWKGRTGRINKEMIEKSSFPLKETVFYLCGSPEFVKSMEKVLLTELNIAEKNVKKISL